MVRVNARLAQPNAQTMSFTVANEKILSSKSYDNNIHTKNQSMRLLTTALTGTALLTCDSVPGI